MNPSIFWHTFTNLSRMQNLRRVGEKFGPILSRLWTNVHEILRRCRRPLVQRRALTRLSISCLVPKIYAVKFAVKLRNRRNLVVWVPIFRLSGYPKNPNFGPAVSNRTHFRICGQFWLSSVCSELRAQPTKNRSKTTSMSGGLIKCCYLCETAIFAGNAFVTRPLSYK